MANGAPVDPLQSVILGGPFSRKGPKKQPCQNVPADFAAYSWLSAASSTLDLTRSPLESKGVWHLLPTTPAYLPTAAFKTFWQGWERGNILSDWEGLNLGNCRIPDVCLARFKNSMALVTYKQWLYLLFVIFAIIIELYKSHVYMHGRKKITQKQLKKVQNTNTETNEKEKGNWDSN